MLLGTVFGQEIDQEEKILSRKKRIDEVNEDYDEKAREVEKVFILNLTCKFIVYNKSEEFHFFVKCMIFTDISLVIS